MADLTGDMPALLFRSRAPAPGERGTAKMEEIGSGPLAVMVRLVLSDPDGEFWPYRITAGGVTIDGNAIVALDRRLRRDRGPGG
jgi:hypothetical protein